MVCDVDWLDGETKEYMGGWKPTNLFVRLVECFYSVQFVAGVNKYIQVLTALR